MGITERERKRRRDWIGSSDVAAIMGLSPYKTALDVYLEKTGGVEDWAGNAATERGTYLERGVMDWAESELGMISRDERIVHDEAHLACNIDGIVIHSGEPVEVKTCHGSVEGWGRPGTDEVPDHVLIQCLAHLAVTPKAKRCWVPVCRADEFAFRLDLYKVERDEFLVGEIVGACNTFWSRVLSLDPPAALAPSADVCRRLKRSPGSTIAIPPEPFDEWREAVAERKAAEKKEKEAHGRLLALLEDNECGEVEGRPDRVLYLPEERRMIDTKALRQNHPRLAEKYTKTSSFRTLRPKRKETNDA